MKIKLASSGNAAVLLLALSPLSSQLSTAFAQGTTFTYQGRLNDGGSPASGNYDLKFTLFGVSSGGSAIAGPLTNSATDVSNGLFTVTLDFGAGVFTGPDRFLEIAARTNGGGAFATLSPRQKLTPVPYAIYSAGASTLSGMLPASQLSGTVSLSQLPGAVLTNGENGASLNGTFTGNGAGMTNVWLGAINSGGAIILQSFVAAVSPAVGSSPDSVIAADVNGDGKLDLISANFGANTLTVLTNNGSSGFGLASSPGVGSGPEQAVAADANGDGKPNLITANFNASTLTVLTNNGSGGFVLASSPSVGSGPNSVAAADINGDGKVDLISANIGVGGSGTTLTVLTNNGSGGFVLASTPNVGTGPAWVTAADVNGDGAVDLVSANNGSGTLSVLTNNGLGGFVPASTLSVGPGPRAVAAADINGDGKLDLISANGGNNTLTVLTNAGNGAFVLAATLSVGALPQSVIAADINGDGKADLISANENDNTLSVLINNGNGSFAPAILLTVGTRPYSVIGADLNGDGRVDLISANFDANSLTVLTNGPGAVTFQGNFNGNGAGLTNLNGANLNGGTVGLSQLAAQSVDSSRIVDGTIVDADISASAAIADTKLATVATAGKVADTALSGNVALRAGGNMFTGNQTFTSGNVGISMTAPGTRLDVNQANSSALTDLTQNVSNHAIAISSTMTLPSYLPGIAWYTSDNNPTQPKAGIWSQQTTSGSYLYFGASDNYANGITHQALTIDYNGWVGINALPVSDFHVSGNTVLEGRLTATAAMTTNLLNLAVGLSPSGSRNGMTFYATAGRTMSLGYDGVPGGGFDALRIYNDDGTARFTFQSSGNLGLRVDTPFNPIQHSSGAMLTDSGVWQNGSDANRKTNFSTVDARETLAKLVRLPVRAWRFTNELDNVRHIGPTAQDFKAAFGLGEDDKSIGTLDEEGVALSAIQGLNQKLAEELKQKQTEITELKQRLERLEDIVSRKNGGER